MVKNTSILFQDEIWKKAKKRATDLNLTLKVYISNLILNDVKKADDQLFDHQKKGAGN